MCWPLLPRTRLDPQPTCPCPAVLQNLVIDRVGRRKLVMGGYSLMAAWAVVFMVALSLQVTVAPLSGQLELQFRTLWLQSNPPSPVSWACRIG